MQLENNIKLEYDDITIIPEIVTDISSRSECNPYDEDGYLPIFAAPMTSVVSIENTENFNKAKIRTVIPRNYSFDDRLTYLKEMRWVKQNPNFVAFSLSEIKEHFIIEDVLQGYWSSFPIKICIDLANGHMKCLLDTVKQLKTKYGEMVVVMTGNIANPETYRLYEEAGVDYVRCSIGSGNACLTSSNLGLHYGIFSLLKEIYNIKKEINGKCKIIADGGIQGYRDIQKALVYADYVMIGSLFNKCIESNGKTTYGTFYWNIRGKKITNPFKTLYYYGKNIPKKKYDKVFKLIKQGRLTVWKQFFGQSTKMAQSLMNTDNDKQTKLKTSEGLIKWQKVEYNIKGWSENEADYLRSAMSYTNSKTLDDYKDSQWIRINRIAYNQ